MPGEDFARLDLAIHEAAHCVSAITNLIPFKTVTIESDETRDGFLLFNTRSLFDRMSSGMTKFYALRWAAVALAGPLANLHSKGRQWEDVTTLELNIWRTDLSIVEDAFDRFGENDPARRKWMFERERGLVWAWLGQLLTQERITSMAYALIDRGTLTEDEARAVDAVAMEKAAVTTTVANVATAR